MKLLQLSCLLAVVAGVQAISECAGDTRGDRKCNHDPTHRVCAKIGVKGTSFWHNTGQTSWCGTRGNYGGDHGSDVRCPSDKPTWCICKWATAAWIKEEGCSDAVSFDCSATDVCNLKASYSDFDVKLKPAHDCMEKKCAAEWKACPEGA